VCVAIVLTRRGFLLGASALCGCTSFNIPRAPGHAWTVDQLDVRASRTLRGILAKADTTGMMVIQRGVAIFTYGDLVQPTYLASARKSLIAMLYGPAVARGQIQLNATLQDIGFEDEGGLLPRERKATIKDLLNARSGVYHPAANLGDASERAPARGSVEPGSYFLYNNWDFNALGAIYQRLTGRDVYQAFEEDIAAPIGMQDWRRDLQAIRNDTGQSRYPAHHFVLSTRDMARIGQLMLCRGEWNGAQVIEPGWVHRISSSVTSAEEVKKTSPFVAGLGYGYLWWIFDSHASWPSSYKRGFTASGAFGQFITVLPQLDLVIAHKTAAPSNKNVSPESYFQTIRPAAVAMAT
jgi:CubicO group peptidase (beta-lactamase class C family)